MCTRMEAFLFYHVESLWNDLSPKMEAKHTPPWVQSCTQNTVGDKSVHFSISWLHFWLHSQVVDTIHCLMKLGVHKMHIIPMYLPA